MSPNTRGLFSAPIVRNEKLSPTCRLLVVERPGNFPDASPGQFVSLRISGTTVPLLRRPYSIMDLTGDSLSLLVKVVGKGSAMLASGNRGEVLDLMGPLGGVPFPEPEGGNAVFAAGGTGLAPMIFAVRMWARRGLLRESCLLYGASDRGELLADLIEDDFTEVRFATIDGSEGFHGDVVSLCENLLEKKLIGTRYLYSCGPRGMVRALVERVDGRFGEHHTSLETVMACGVGACRGCTVPVVSPGGMVFKAICSDGTVFKARDVAWDEWEKWGE